MERVEIHRSRPEQAAQAHQPLNSVELRTFTHNRESALANEIAAAAPLCFANQRPALGSVSTSSGVNRTVQLLPVRSACTLSHCADR